MTAQEAVLRIEKYFGAGWKNSGADGFKAGNPATPVTGIVTAWTPSMDVLQKAVQSKQNLVITVQPPFWAGQGGGGGRGGRAAPTAKGGARPGAQTPALKAENTDLYQFKKKYIEDHGLVLWRFGENWQSLPSLPRERGLAATFGWSKQADVASSARVAEVGAGVYALPTGRLGSLVAQMKTALAARAMRVVGDPGAMVSRVVLRPGYLLVPDAVQLVRETKADVVVCGEACEWEAFTYFDDWVTAGLGKGFVMLGNAVSEQPGAHEMATWIKSLVSEVPVAAIPSEEPFAVA